MNFYQNLEASLRSGGLGEIAGDFSTGARLHWSGPIPDEDHLDQDPCMGGVRTGESALKSMPRIKVTTYDIEANGNTQCVVCLQELVPGECATRIPCGHLFHESCIKQWLCRSNQCPVCRYELPTDNTEYEQGRRERMAARRPRLHHRDITVKTAQELLRLAEHLGVNTSGCLEKSELVERIASSGKVEIVAEPMEAPVAQQKPVDAAQRLTSQELSAMTVRDLKAELAKSGIDAKGCLEKGDLVQLLSGPIETNTTKMRDLSSYSVRELREIAVHIGASLGGCLEKSDITKRIDDVLGR